MTAKNPTISQLMWPAELFEEEAPMQTVTPISKRQIKERIANLERLVQRRRDELAEAEQKLAEAREMKPVSAPRIDSLKQGQQVVLGFHGYDGGEEGAMFLGIKGDGDDRRACFRSAMVDGGTFDWEAYRYNGGWCYGSSADRLSLVAVEDPS